MLGKLSITELHSSSLASLEMSTYGGNRPVSTKARVTAHAREACPFDRNALPSLCSPQYSLQPPTPPRLLHAVGHLLASSA